MHVNKFWPKSLRGRGRVCVYVRPECNQDDRSAKVA